MNEFALFASIRGYTGFDLRPSAKICGRFGRGSASPCLRGQILGFGCGFQVQKQLKSLRSAIREKLDCKHFLNFFSASAQKTANLFYNFLLPQKTPRPLRLSPAFISSRSTKEYAKH